MSRDRPFFDLDDTHFGVSYVMRRHTLWGKELVFDIMPRHPDATGTDPSQYEENAKIAVWIYEGDDPKLTLGKWFVVRYSVCPTRRVHEALTFAFCTGPD